MDIIPASVIVITKNEEHDLPRALESVKFFQEIVIVDSFSTDCTVEIARKYTSHVHQHEWPGFALQRERAIAYATLPWILMLDADEAVTPELCKEIRALLQHTPEHNGYEMRRKNYFLGKAMEHSGFGKDFVLRFFKKEKAKMERREVHERVLVEGSVGKLTHVLEHYAHANLSDYIEKMHVYASLSARQMMKEKRRISGGTLALKTLYAFFKIYVLNRGILDGTRGFMLAVLFSFSTFLKYAKLWEYTAIAVKNKGLEK